MKIKKICCILIVFLTVFFVNTIYSDANVEIYESTDKQEENGNITYPVEVNNDMKIASYWADKLGQEADKLLLNTNEIETINQEIIDGAGTGVYDITKISETKTQGERKTIVAQAIENDFNYMVRNYPEKDRKLYVDGQLIDNLPYIENLKNNALTTGFENDDEIVQLYAVGIRRTEVKMFPTKSIWGYDSPEDPDDESCNSALEVNEPFVIRAKCTIDNDTFYWGLTRDCSGWVYAEDLVLFDSKKEWIESWNVDINGKDFLVVTQDNIILEPSKSSPETSEVQLKLGTILKLVPQDEIPESVNERATWNNYVVYLPTRDESGKYVRSYALIAEHYDVSIGYMPLTQRNLLNVAFTCLGNRYGWGGMLGAMDCSAYSKAIYKCFGLKLPRNTTNQQNVPNRVVSFDGMTEEEKELYIEKMPIGSVFFFPGHAMIYIGSENGKNYVISDTGSLSDSEGDLNVRTMYSVIVNPLTVRRKNGNTWLKSLTKALVFGEISASDEIVENADEEDIYVVIDKDEQKGNLTYADGINYNMAKSSYWKELLSEDKELMNFDEIQKLNLQLNQNNNNNDLKSKNVLVVTQDKIVLEQSALKPEISEVELPMGTVLELVPKDKIPLNLAERGPWYNYVVYLPVINKNGEMEKKYALIPEHYNVSIGYLSLTSNNIIDVAFTCLGDSYELMNNTKFISSVYKCFGIELSFEADMKNKLKNKWIDVSSLTVDEKIKKINNLPVGSILQIKEEYVIYLGTQNDNYYIISSMNGKINSIVLSKIELKNLTSIIDFSQKIEDDTKEEPNDEPEKDIKEDQKEIKYYDVIEGKNQEIIEGQEATFRIDADFSLFENGGEVYIDDILVGSENYIAKSGSTIITFMKEYMNTLAMGEHLLKVTFTDGGVAETKFTITRENEILPVEGETIEVMAEDIVLNNPKTGDNIALWIMLMIISIVGFAVTFKGEKT